MHDVIVLSDLHLGRGKNPETGRYFSLEAFFYDDDLRRFLRYLCDESTRGGVPFKLVFNGDVFDLLRIEPEDAGPEATRRERRFGPAATPAIAARMTAEILAGHPGFVDGVAQVLEAGHEVVFLPGNHDIELQWAPVQAEVRRAIVERVHARGGDVATVERYLRFEPWFYHEPGRLWVEHGCQYDAESSFRYPLRSSMLALGEGHEAEAETEVDLPLGSFTQRYLYNAFGPITFMVPSTRANFRYFKWLLVNRPRLLARVLKSHGPFAWQLLRRVARAAAVSKQRLQRGHERELRDLAASSGLGERLLRIDALKDTKHDLVAAARALGWQFTKFAGLGLMVAILVTGLWFAGFATINALGVGVGLKALSFLGLNFLLLVAAAVGMGYALFRAQPTISTGSLWNAANEISNLLDVPVVTFGHTHDEALWRLDTPGRRSWYFNTGTWIAVFTHEELMPRERVQFTFLRVRGHEGELLQWSPGRGEPMPVILLDEEGRGGTPMHAGGATAPS